MVFGPMGNSMDSNNPYGNPEGSSPQNEDTPGGPAQPSLLFSGGADGATPGAENLGMETLAAG